MLNRAVVALLALVSSAGIVIGQSPSAPAQLSPADRWQRAVDAWEAGSYPHALDDLRALMRSPAAAEYLDRVALLTGELFVTTTLTTAGDLPRLSANGGYASYQNTTEAGPMTSIIRLGAKPEKIAVLPTAAVAFDNAGKRLSWLRYVKTGDPTASEIVVRDLASGKEDVWLGTGMSKSELKWSSDGEAVLFLGSTAADRSDVYRLRAGQTPEVLTPEPGRKSNPVLDATGRTLIYTELAANAGGGRGSGAGRGGGGGAAAAAGAATGGGDATDTTPPQTGGRGGGRGGPSNYGIVSLADKSTRKITGNALTLSADGSTIAWISREADVATLKMASAAAGEAITVRTGRDRIDAPALSADGKQVAYQLMTNTDWEIFVSDAAGTHRRVTRDIQHDLLPKFIGPDKLIGMKGEARHRRSYLHDLTTGTTTRLFANNTIRTISPEYIWLPSADGKTLLIHAERDGDTVSAERDVNIVDLTRKVTVADVLARLDKQHAAETELRDRMTKAYQPVAELTRRVLAKGLVNRVYDYEKTLFDFDTKYIGRPGNLKAIEYLERTYRSFGYTPEVQWFVPPARGQQQQQQQPAQPQPRTANVVATLKGTENPSLVYVVSSHFDSGQVTAGADDDTSGTAALLETARMLAGTPLPATIVFASFTGEEAGLYGSREFVRLAAQNKWQIVGALNNDMIGWSADSSRMDNTIRYSNPGIRDIQHGASFLFTNLILYDAKYYKGTDAAAFYDGWGDIVGGIGSYPVLANPNYHQASDVIETMNFQQILETAKVTAATLIYLTSTPSRLKDLTATRTASGVDLTWTPGPEAGIKNYVVAYGPANDPLKTRVTVTGSKTSLPSLPAGTQIAVKAVNARGMESWDWARTSIK